MGKLTLGLRDPTHLVKIFVTEQRIKAKIRPRAEGTSKEWNNITLIQSPALIAASC